MNTQNSNPSLSKVFLHLPVILVLTAIAVLVIFPVRDFDTFWHLANGRAMIETGRIVNEELFSFTAYGKTFHNHEWLSQIIYFLVYDHWHANGLIIFKTFLILTVCFILIRTAVTIGVSPVTASLLCLVTALVSLPRFVERPHLFSFLNLALLGYILYTFRNNPRSKKILGFIPLIMVVWDFLHGAVFGIILCGAFVAAETIKYLLAYMPARPFHAWPGLTPLAPDRFRALWLWAGVTLVLMLLNPYGLLTYDIFFSFVRDNLMASMTSEFQPPGLKNNLLFWGLLGLVGLSFVPAGRRANLTDMIIFLPFAVLAIRYVRCIGDFALVTLPILATNLTLLPEKFTTGRAVEFSRRLLLTLGILGIIFYIGYIKFIASPNSTSFGLGINDNAFPVGSVRFIKSVDLQGNMYNTDRYGGYLAYFVTPERKIFHYNHHILFYALQRFVHDPSSRAQWDINYAIIAREDEWRMFTQDGYVPIYWEPTAAVMIRDSSVNQGIIDRYRIRYFEPLMPEGKIRTLSGNPAIFPILAREMATYLQFRSDRRLADLLGELLARSGPSPSVQDRIVMLAEAETYNMDSAKLKETLGILYYGQQDLNAARRLLTEALTLDSNLTAARFNLAYVCFDQGSFQEASRHFMKLLDITPKNTNAMYGLALSYYKLGLSAQARQTFEQFLQLTPSGPWAAKARVFLQQLP